MDYNTLYTEIGRMAYALAKANGSVSDKDSEFLVSFINAEMEQTGTDAVLYVGAEFNKLRSMNASARDAFSAFTGYVEKHSTNFQDRIIHLCMRLAIKIAATDDGIDETETALINKLRKKFDLIKPKLAGC